MRILNIRTLALFTLLSTLTFISCQKDENAPVSKNGLIPMKTGNQWFYKYYWLDDNIVDTAVLSVGDYVNINGNKGFKFSSGDYPFHENFIFDNDDEGNCISVGGYSDKDTLFAPSVRYKIDAKKGDSWNFQEISFDENGIFEKINTLMFCVSADTTIDTPIGNFKCKAYKWTPDSGDDWFFDYISENIGIIKSEHYDSNKLFSIQVLYSYKIEK